MQSCSLGTSESQLPTAATKISVCLLFIPPSPAEPTQRQEWSWSLFLALQGRERESLCCRRAGLGAARSHPLLVPRSLTRTQGDAKAGMTAPQWGQSPTFWLRRSWGDSEREGCPSTSLSIAAGFSISRERLQCRQLWKGSPLLQSCFSAWVWGTVGGLESQLLLPPGRGGLRGAKGSELTVTP